MRRLLLILSVLAINGVACTPTTPPVTTASTTTTTAPAQGLREVYLPPIATGYGGIIVETEFYPDGAYIQAAFIMDFNSGPTGGAILCASMAEGALGPIIDDSTNCFEIPENYNATGSGMRTLPVPLIFPSGQYRLEISCLGDFISCRDEPHGYSPTESFVRIRW